ncbi:MAG: hypothetical protein K8W52_41775 [Deltaproteobacteria bacterium]|nr:hypothetical protein [Deltaproteobacteria bacterium]
MIAGLGAAAWIGRDDLGPVAQLQAELLCAFLALTAIVLVAVPLVARARWRRTIGMVPLGLLVGAAAWAYGRSSTAELARVAGLAAAVALAIGLAALATRRR